jgi:hypothetical protein
MIREQNLKKKTDKLLEEQQLKVRDERKSRVFLRQSGSLTTQINDAKKRLIMDKSLKTLPSIVNTKDPDEKVVEDEKFLSKKFEREKAEI